MATARKVFPFHCLPAPTLYRASIGLFSLHQALASFLPNATRKVSECLVTSQPQSRGARKHQRPVFLRSQRLWVCPTKAPCASVVTVAATATTGLEQSWPGSPQS